MNKENKYMKTLQDLSLHELQVLLTNYQKTLLEEIDILSESTKQLGNDRINDIKQEMKKRGAI
jgi:hypothetical protein